jgi:hypothetical protein
LTETEFHHVAQWSPIGEWITYAQRDGFGIISPDGKESRVLFKGRPPIMPAFWSKDGNTLYALTYNANKLVLIGADIAGGPEKIIGDLDPGYPQSWVQPGIRLTLAPDGKDVCVWCPPAKRRYLAPRGFRATCRTAGTPPANVAPKRLRRQPVCGNLRLK